MKEELPVIKRVCAFWPEIYILLWIVIMNNGGWIIHVVKDCLFFVKSWSALRIVVQLLAVERKQPWYTKSVHSLDEFADVRMEEDVEPQIQSLRLDFLLDGYLLPDAGGLGLNTVDFARLHHHGLRRRA